MSFVDQETDRMVSLAEEQQWTFDKIGIRNVINEKFGEVAARVADDTDPLSSSLEICAQIACDQTKSIITQQILLAESDEERKAVAHIDGRIVMLALKLVKSLHADELGGGRC